MQFKKYYKDILSLVASLSLLGTVYFVNHYDIKQLYREFATLSLKVKSQENQIKTLSSRVDLLAKQNQDLLIELENHNKTRGNENALLLERLKDLEYKVEVLSMKSTITKNSKVFNDRFEFVDKQENRIGNYETKGQVLVAWKDDYLATKKVNVNTIGEINLVPKIKKLDKDEFVSYIDESYLDGITIHGQGKVQKIETPILLQSIKWVKSMRWGSHNDRWIRPIKNILCIFNNKLLKIKFAGLDSNNFTFGNYHFEEKKFQYGNYLNYQEKLRKTFVILDSSDRQKLILKKIDAFCKKNNLQFINDSSLLKRISNSVEFPNVYFGSFDNKFFKIPEFLLENIMSDKQDYFIFNEKNN